MKYVATVMMKSNGIWENPKDLRYDIKYIELNQIVILYVIQKRWEKMRLKKEQLYPEIVKLDDGHEMVVVHDHEGSRQVCQWNH